jgi:ribA/ribD-fused uncharacterized protein
MSKWIRNWFSNFNKLAKPIRAQGIEYHTVENFFQAMKTTDIEERYKIAAMSPWEAKRHCSRKNKNFKLREDWEEIKLNVMEWALRRKYRRGTPDHTQLMESTEKSIIEFNNWHDNIWGQCTCKRCSDGQEFDPANDYLGRLLTQIRQEHRKGLICSNCGINCIDIGHMCQSCNSKE